VVDEVLKSFAEYFPVKSPLARGDQGITPSPISLAIGISSRSPVRSTRLYSICIATKGDQPLKSAMACIRETCQAGVSEIPTYSTLPDRTRSSIERRISSTGVVPGKHRWRRPLAGGHVPPAQRSEDTLDHGPILDEADTAQAAGAVRTDERIDFIDSFADARQGDPVYQPRPRTTDLCFEIGLGFQSGDVCGLLLVGAPYRGILIDLYRATRYSSIDGG
jgi:hypothetical protein